MEYGGIGVEYNSPSYFILYIIHSRTESVIHPIDTIYTRGTVVPRISGTAVRPIINFVLSQSASAFALAFIVVPVLFSFPKMRFRPSKAVIVMAVPGMIHSILAVIPLENA